MKILKTVGTLLIMGLIYVLYASYNSEKNSEVIIGAREVPSSDLKKGTIFISPQGNNPACTQSHPCNLERGIKKSKAGDTVFFRAGIYDMSTLHNPQKRIKLHSGTPEKPITYESYPNEMAIFDGSKLKENELGSIIVRDYTHLRKIEIRNMNKVGIKVRGDHNLIEGINSHHNHSAGIHIYSKNGYKLNSVGGSYNTIKDCKVHHNSDINLASKGNDSDGISVSNGINNLITHTSVYANSDDGIDTWKSINTTIEYSLSYQNGKEKGDGKGFKLGGDNNLSSPLGSGAIARFNIAYDNRNGGFSENSGKKVILQNNSAYKNGGYGFIAFNAKSSLLNNISYKNEKKEFYGNTKIATNNSWQLKKIINDNDFISLKFDSPNFLHPKQNTKLSTIGTYISHN